MSNTKHRVGSTIAIVASVIIVLFAAWLIVNRQYVADALKVSSYQPDATIASIQERTKMTDKGRFMFYATKPEVMDAQSFNQSCPRQEVGSPILGCYTGDDRIYIYNLTDKKLDGMEEVTAAHEMLHAVWQRTDAEQKRRLSDLLTSAYKKLDDDALQKRMAYYERNEPTEFTNELHSILGTEVKNLDDDLESYYSQFFDRAEVLALHDKYNGFYTNLVQQSNDLYEKMEKLADSIDARSKTYDANISQLSADITSFNTRANNGDFNSQAQFYSERAALVNRSNQLEADRSAINEDITTYNSYYTKYTKIAGQIQLLNDSMDSYQNLEKAPSL